MQVRLREEAELEIARREEKALMEDEDEDDEDEDEHEDEEGVDVEGGEAKKAKEQGDGFERVKDKVLVLTDANFEEVRPSARYNV